MIREMAEDPRTELIPSAHARARLSERNIDLAVIRFVLRHGVVRDDPERIDLSDLFRCNMACMSPDRSSSREIAVVCVPKPAERTIYVISPFWVDERGTIGGSLLGGGDD